MHVSIMLHSAATHPIQVVPRRTYGNTGFIICLLSTYLTNGALLNNNLLSLRGTYGGIINPDIMYIALSLSGYL